MKWALFLKWHGAIWASQYQEPTCQDSLNSLTSNSLSSVSVWLFLIWYDFWALSKQTVEVSLSLLLYKLVFSRMDLLVGFYCSAIIGCPCGVKRGVHATEVQEAPVIVLLWNRHRFPFYITFFLKKETVLKQLYWYFFPSLGQCCLPEV